MISNAQGSIILARAAAAVTRLIETDALATARLRELSGRIIALRLGGYEAALYATVDAAGLALALSAQREPDVALTGSVRDFIAFARARQTQAVPVGKLQIQGDLATAQLVQTLLDDLNIDWEELLAQAFGDVAARQLGRGIRGGLRWVSEARARWTQDLSAYLIDESRIVPAPREVEELTRTGMSLVSDVERLGLRVERLAKRRRKPC